MKRWSPTEHWALLKFLMRWLILATPVAVVTGLIVALFLYLLDRATAIRFNFPSLLYFLPLAGAGIGALYHRFGRSVEGGNNLVIEQIHAPGGGVPARMTPLVLVGTVLTHLFGGSAGREGTAVQIGGSIASQAARYFKLQRAEIRILLMVGVAAGFGAVFGTPLAGAVFALEVLTIGRLSYAALVPCFAGSLIAHLTVIACHIHHTQYRLGDFAAPIADALPLDGSLMLKVSLASIAFGAASVLFVMLTHGIANLAKRTIEFTPARPFFGGLLVIFLALLIGRDYLGLGVTADPHHPQEVSIVSAFTLHGATPWSWLWKTIFTAVTVGSGFKGGEVTPLFYIGATLGNALAAPLHAPVDLLAALGFVAVFAGATNTPLACTIMGVELFGTQPGALGHGLLIYLAIACFGSYLVSGRHGIYTAQRLASAEFA